MVAVAAEHDAAAHAAVHQRAVGAGTRSLAASFRVGGGVPGHSSDSPDPQRSHPCQMLKVCSMQQLLCPCPCHCGRLQALSCGVLRRLHMLGPPHSEPYNHGSYVLPAGRRPRLVPKRGHGGQGRGRPSSWRLSGPWPCCSQDVAMRIVVGVVRSREEGVGGCELRNNFMCS